MDYLCNSYGCLWMPIDSFIVSIDSYRIPLGSYRIPMDSHGFLQNYYGFLWISSEPLALWIPRDSYRVLCTQGFLCILMDDSYGLLWIPMDSYGFFFLMDSYGIPMDSYRIPLNSYGFL